jgi:hypothetical protein
MPMPQVVPSFCRDERWTFLFGTAGAVLDGGAEDDGATLLEIGTVGVPDVLCEAVVPSDLSDSPPEPVEQAERTSPSMTSTPRSIEGSLRPERSFST